MSILLHNKIIKNIINLYRQFGMKYLKLFVVFLLLQFCFVVVANDYNIYRWMPINDHFDSIAYRLDNGIFYDYARSSYSHEVKELNIIGEASENNQLKARAAFWTAWLNARTNPNNAFNLIEKAFKLNVSSLYSYDTLRMKYLKGDILRAKGQWVESYIINKEIEQEFEKIKDYFWQAKSCVSIGAILQNLGENQEALNYFQKANDIFEKIECKNCQIKNRINISNNLYMLGKKQQALNILKELEKEPVVMQDTLYLVNVLISIFSVSDQKELKASNKAYNLIKKMHYDELLSLVEMTRGSEMKIQHKNDSALYYYRLAWASAILTNDVYNKPIILKGLSETFYQIGKSDSAYYYMNLANIYQDSLIDYNKIMELSRLENRAMFEKYEAEKQIIEQRGEYQRNIAYMITIALTLFFCLIFYILWLSRRKANMSEQLKDTQNRELMLQNKQHLLEIESMHRELSSNTMLIAQKNAKLKELYSKLEQNDANDKVSDELKIDIKSQLINDDDWQYFIIKFEKIYPHFFENLKQQFSSLSETELRLCAYIRIGMSAKEIAKILSIQPETVNTSRYRIRKKMKLSSGESLEALLRSF